MAEELAKTTPTQLPKSTTDPDSPKKEPPLAVSTPPQTLTISIPYPPSSIFSPTGNGQLTFSQLLADAMAASGSPSPLGNSPGPLQISPVQMVAAPCFVNPTGVIESPHQLTGSLGMTHQAALASVTAQAQKQLQKGHHLPSHTSTIGNMYSQSSVSSLQRLSGSIEGTIITPKADQLPISEIKSLSIQTVVKTTSSDGYNWRKYGQKQVKASEISRSYYRCTHVNCSAKKKIEHYHDGRVIEVVYLGEHGHEPTPVKIKWSREKESLGSQSISPLKDDKALEMIEKEKSNHYPVKNEQDPDLQIAELKKSEHSQAKSYEDPGHEKPEKLHHSSSDHEMDGKNKPDKNDEGPDPKRSKLCEVPVAYEPSLFKTVREGKVVVKNSFDEVPAGDGYRWRKYGQKIVKGSLSPRSYYKCTHLGCPVRKHVERAEDVKAVITTYEGHHNHDIPPLRSNSDVSSPRASILPKQSSTPLEKNPSKSKLVSNKMITDEKASEPGDKSLESDKTTADVELDLSSEGKAEVILPKSSQGLCLTVKVQQQFQSRTHEC